MTTGNKNTLSLNKDRVVAYQGSVDYEGIKLAAKRKGNIFNVFVQNQEKLEKEQAAEEKKQAEEQKAAEKTEANKKTTSLTILL